MTLNKEEIKSIRKLQATLVKIDQNEKVFFNLVKFREMELITERNIWKKDSSGNKVIVGTKYGLSEKGKRILEAMI